MKIKKFISCNVKHWFLTIVLLSLSLIAIVVIVGMIHNNKADSKVLGERAVMLLYDFGTVEQLNKQMTELKAITTDDVFNQLSIDNSGRTLNTYLKFKNKPVTVNIIKSTSTYVLYSLETESISPERLFLFLFSVRGGKIDGVREMEGIDFVTTY